MNTMMTPYRQNGRYLPRKVMLATIGFVGTLKQLLQVHLSKVFIPAHTVKDIVDVRRCY